MEWNQQDRGRNITRADMQEKDGGQDDAQLEIKVSNEGEFPRSLEELTDDDVFNELINIVVDVFSHKSEKCMLTFELPVQSRIKTVSTDNLCGSALEPLNGRVEDGRYISDIRIPITSSESSIVSRCSTKRRKLPIFKPARRGFKKIFDKKLNPVVQTVLNAKQGFTDLESLFKFRNQSSSYKLWNHDKKNTNQRQGIGPIEQNTFSERSDNNCDIRSDEEETNITEEKCDLYLTHSPPNQKPSRGDGLRAAGKLRLQSELADVLDSLKMLIRAGDESLLIDSHRIDYHVTEMKSHLFAIKSYLCSSASELSSFGETTETNLDSKKVSISRNKRRPSVVLCRMASSQSHQCKRKKPKDTKTSKLIDVVRVVPGVTKKKTKEHNLNQNDLLRGYQQIKKEETRLVKLLLNRLELADKIREENLIHGKVHKQHSKPRGVHSRSQSSELCRSGGSEDFTHQLSTLNIEDNKLNRMESSEVLPRNRQKMMKHEVEEAHQNKTDKTCQRKGRRLLRRSFVNINESRSTTRRFQRDEMTELHPSPKQQDELNSQSESNLPDSGHVGEDLYEQIQSLNDGCSALLPFREEENVMCRIHNAAERLEHMQSLVEEKLNYLCKKKQLYREMKSMVLKCQARQDMMAAGDEIMIEKQELSFEEQTFESVDASISSPQVSTACDHSPSIIQIAYSNLEECQDFRDLVKDFVGVSGMTHTMQPKDSKVNLYQNQGTQHVEIEESRLQGITSKSYICNYMMEIRDCDSMDDICPNQMVHGAEDSVEILSCNEKTNALEDGKYMHHIIQKENGKSTIQKPNFLTKGESPRENDARIDEPKLAFEKNRLTFGKGVIVKKRKRRLISRKTWCTLI